MNTTALSLYTQSTAIAIHQLNQDDQFVFSTLDDMVDCESLYHLPVYAALVTQISEPTIEYINEMELYGHFFFQNNYYLIGPVLHHPILTLKDQYHLSFFTSLHEANRDLRAHQIPMMSIEAFSQHLMFIYYLITHQKASIVHIPHVPMQKPAWQRYVDQDAESTLLHVKEAIKKRDITEIVNISTRKWHGYHHLLSMDSFYQSIYLYISIITYCAQYATDEGASFQDVTALKDAYILQADQEHDRNILLQHFQQYIHELILLIPDRSISPEIRKCQDYIHHHLDETLDTMSLSRICHLSRAYLCQLFKQETGLTIAHYVLNCRIQQAQKELSESRDSITSIAEKLGFKSQSHFTTVFKKETKMTPKAWRQKYQLNI